MHRGLTQRSRRRAHGARHAADETALGSAFVLAGGRTFEQGPQYVIQLLVDFAIKALSLP
ncbi:MAG: hypothetical protein KJ025_00785 [Burkholderiales bacterium]|nr:hypothetical protein [Burkholderiales bacterium]